MGAKRAKLEGVAMVDFIIAELDKASKLDADTKSTLEGFKGSAPAAAAPVAAAPVAAAPIDFNIKSIDFIKDKEVRGTAKKAFMGAKRAKLEGVAMVDFIIAELDKASKLDADTKSTLEGFKGSAPAAAAIQYAAAPVAAAPIDFNIKSIDFIKDKEVRGTAKKAFMGAKRAKLEGVAMVDFIIAELDKASKLDADTKSTLEGFKEGKI